MPPPPSLAGTADASDLLDAAPALAIKALPAVSDNVLKGIGLIIASTLFFSVADVVAKIMTASLPAMEVTWLRYFFFVILILPVALAANGSAAFATTRPGLQFFRALAVVAASAFFMLGLQHLQPAEATGINFISPLFITALSIPLLGEKVGVRRWAAGGVGFLGVMLIVRPGSDAFQMAALFPIAAALVWAGGAIATRKMSAERPETILVWTALVGFVCLSFVMPFIWVRPDWREIGLAALTGVLSTVGHWFVVKAFRLAPASVLAPFSYTQLLFAGVMGLIAFGVVPGPWVLTGGLVIAASGLYTAHRERVKRAEFERA